MPRGVLPRSRVAAEAFAASELAPETEAGDLPGAEVVSAEDPAALRRDDLGRFAPAGRRPRKGGRPRAGRRGPSHLARMPHRHLVRRCVVLEHVVGRLEAEWTEVEWRDPAGVVLPRMAGIDALRDAGQAERLAALDIVLLAMAEDRVPHDAPGRHEVIAARVREVLAMRVAARAGAEDVGRGGAGRRAGVGDASPPRFSWRTLYREPYRTRWRVVEDVLGSHAADRAAAFAAVGRWAKPRLTWRILKLRARRDELLRLLRARLVERAAGEDGWDAIPKR